MTSRRSAVTRTAPPLPPQGSVPSGPPPHRDGGLEVELGLPKLVRPLLDDLPPDERVGGDDGHHGSSPVPCGDRAGRREAEYIIRDLTAPLARALEPGCSCPGSDQRGTRERGRAAAHLRESKPQVKGRAGRSPGALPIPHLVFLARGCQKTGAASLTCRGRGSRWHVRVQCCLSAPRTLSGRRGSSCTPRPPRDATSEDRVPRWGLGRFSAATMADPKTFGLRCELIGHEEDVRGA